MELSLTSLLRKAAPAIVAAGLLAAPAIGQAQEEELAGPNTGKVHVTFGADVTNLYVYRGILQENQGVITQPWLGLNVALWESVGPNDVLENVVLNAGIWNSLHSSGPSGGGGEFWFEAAPYVGLSADLSSKLGLSVAYSTRHSPAAGTSIVGEVTLGLEYDDAELWGGDFSLNPYVQYLVETNGNSDGDGEEGQYIEVGVEPTFDLSPNESLPLTLSVPVVLGWGLDDYYGSGGEDFGFLDFGIGATVPLSMVSSDYGSWKLNASIHGILLGNQPEILAMPVNGGDDFEIYGRLGVSMEY